MQVLEGIELKIEGEHLLMFDGQRNRATSILKGGNNASTGMIPLPCLESIRGRNQSQTCAGLSS
jgi:hypothetical protein